MLKIKDLRGFTPTTKYNLVRGFTIIEVLIATFILIMVGVAAIGVERNFMGSASVNKHKLQATALAQEGISAVRAAYNQHLLDPNNHPALESGYYQVLNNGSIVKQFDGYSDSSPALELNNVQFTRTVIVP